MIRKKIKKAHIQRKEDRRLKSAEVLKGLSLHDLFLSNKILIKA